MKNKSKFPKLEYESSLTLRNFEITLFWRRAWFFGALLVALSGGYFKLLSSPETLKYAIFLSFLALLVSVGQSLMNRGSKYWQERWEYKTKNKEHNLGIDVTLTENLIKDEKETNNEQQGQRERDYIDASLISKDENFIASSARFSVSKITILIWDIISIFWLFVWVRDTNFFQFNNCKSYNGWAILFHLIIIGYIIFFIVYPSKKEFKPNRKIWEKLGGRVYEPLSKKLAPDLYMPPLL